MKPFSLDFEPGSDNVAYSGMMRTFSSSGGQRPLSLRPKLLSNSEKLNLGAKRLIVRTQLIWIFAFFSCAGEQRAPKQRLGMVYVIGFGRVSQSSLQRSAWALREETQRPVQILSRQPLPKESLLSDGRVQASLLLDRLLLSAPKDSFRIVGVTQKPLFGVRQGELIGYARKRERGLLLSLYELPRKATEARHRQRIRKIIVHELGHTYGANHCEAKCSMRGGTLGHDLDMLPERLCPLHQRQREEALELHPEHPKFLTDLGRERLRIGLQKEAIEYFRAALHQRPGDTMLWTALGVSLMIDGQLLAADDAFGLASFQAPQAPQPFYGRAVLYGAGYRPQKASAFIEAAVSRDGDSLKAHRAAGIFYQGLMGDVRQAIRHFQRHLDLGGRDPEVIARLVYLLSPTTLVIQEPEMIIARWEHGELLFAAQEPTERAR